MLDLEILSEYTKAVLAIVIGEHVIKMLSKDEGFEYSQKLLDDLNFEYYSKISEDATNSNIYLLFGGIASYIGAQVMLEQEEALPQYWEVVEDDDGYIECVLDVIKIVNENYFEDYKLQQVLSYCQEKEKENQKIRFHREEILKIALLEA